MSLFSKKIPPVADPFVIHEDDVSDNDVSGTIKKRWVEDAWSQFTNQALEHKSNLAFLGLAVSQKRLIGVLFLTSLVALIFFIRSFNLQIISGDFYLAKAEANRLRIKAVPAERGVIYDAKMRPLVTNIPTFILELIPAFLPKDKNRREQELEKIAELASVPKEEIEKTLSDFEGYNYRAITIKDNLDYESAVKLVVASADMPGLAIEKRSGRLYLINKLYCLNKAETDQQKLDCDNTVNKDAVNSLSHVIGYMGKVSRKEISDARLNQEKGQKFLGYLPTDYIGKTGLEKEYELIMRGVYGKKEIEVDALGREKGVISAEVATPGASLLLTINLKMQQKLEEIMINNLAKMGKKRAAGIILDPQNGDIIAAVSLPTYDNNIFTSSLSQENFNKLIEDENHPLFARAWSGAYPAGSVIKPLVAAAALSEGVITEKTSFESAGGLEIGQWFFPDWKPGGHGITNVVKALAESVNTFFYITGGGYKSFTGLGVEKILVYYKKFGLAQRLVLDAPNENAGFLPSPDWKESVKKEKWYIGDTYNISIGQGDVLVTPLQVAVYTSVFANGGNLFEPHLVKGFLKPDGGENVKKPKILASQIIQDEVIKSVRRGLRAAVLTGSARRLADLPVTAAGKTGTAQWSKTHTTHAWFTGFAPYENPKIVITILVEEGGEGSAVAVPIARDFLDWWSRFGQ